MGKWDIPEKGNQNAVQKCLFQVASAHIEEALDGEGEWHQRCQKEKQQHCPAFEHLERQLLS